MSDFVLHPAFGTNINNGGWSSDLEGMWVAKFPAGYAGGGKTDSNNNVTPVDSGEVYSGIYNNLTNYYGQITSGVTTMKYPVFMPQTYAYNYINIGDSYKLAKSLTKSGNPYGLSSSLADSHQMKNSEWGAVAYLTHSKYGLNGQNSLYINNVNLNDTVSTIYAVTGYAGTGTDTAQNSFSTAPATLGSSISGGSTSYAWNTANGQKGSSTQNITGIYDLNGCILERVSTYLGNTSGEASKINYGGALVSEANLRYKTIYPYNSSSDSNTNNYTAYSNAKTNSYGYGDAILETSTSGSGSTSWNGDSSYFIYQANLYMMRGGYFGNSTAAGIFSFNDTYRCWILP